MLRTIEDKRLDRGEQFYTIDLSTVSSGMYYLQIKAGDRLFNEKKSNKSLNEGRKDGKEECK